MAHLKRVLRNVYMAAGQCHPRRIYAVVDPRAAEPTADHHRATWIAAIAGDVSSESTVRIHGIGTDLIALRVQNDPARKTKKLAILVKCGLADASKRHIVDKSIDPIGSMNGIPEEVVAA